MAQQSIICPTDGVQINENKVRVVAFLVLLTIGAYLLTNSIWLPVVLAIDFGVRGFVNRQYSPFRVAADWLVNQLGLPYKPTDQAPKRFAARIGFVFAIAIVLFHSLGWNTVLLSSVLALFASLESLVGFCAGCFVYTYYQRWFTPRTTTS